MICAQLLVAHMACVGMDRGGCWGARTPDLRRV